jgi:hypothetical protein
MAPDAVMIMPIQRFWLFSESIDRIQSSLDLRAIRVGVATTAYESLSTTVEALTESVGTVVHQDYDRDNEGIKKLKALTG